MDELADITRQTTLRAGHQKAVSNLNKQSKEVDPYNTLKGYKPVIASFTAWCIEARYADIDTVTGDKHGTSECFI